MQTFENLLLQNYSTKFLDITYNSPWICVINVSSNGGATCIIEEIIAKDNLNIENLMQTFENLLLQNYSTKFLDITHKQSLYMCYSRLLKWWCHLYCQRNNS